MKIQLFSDLHMEFFRRELAGKGDVAVHPDADLVVLAGDIDVGENSLKQAIALSQKYGVQVAWLPGNHEFYNGDYLALMKKYRATQWDGVFVLCDASYIIDGVRFVGAPLWTDFGLYKGSVRMPTAEEAMRVGQVSLNDFRLIGYGRESFTAKKSAELHAESRKFIESVLDTPFAGKTVLVSHHGVHPKSVHPRFAPGERVLKSPVRLPDENPNWRINPCFVSDLTPLLEKVALSLHGHIHDSVSYSVGKCRVETNPRGYPMRNRVGELVWENPAYDPLKLIEV